MSLVWYVTDEKAESIVGWFKRMHQELTGKEDPNKNLFHGPLHKGYTLLHGDSLHCFRPRNPCHWDVGEVFQLFKIRQNQHVVVANVSVPDDLVRFMMDNELPADHRSLVSM